MFIETDVAAQVGTFALVPQIADAVKVPVIAAGGIADARGVAAAFALGASGVQIGTAYLRCPEAHISELHRVALKKPEPATVITNVLTGRPARAIINRFIAEEGPVSPETPAFPLATQADAPAQDDCREARLRRLLLLLVRRGPRPWPRHECRGSDADHRGREPRSAGSPRLAPNDFVMPGRSPGHPPLCCRGLNRPHRARPLAEPPSPSRGGMEYVAPTRTPDPPPRGAVRRRLWRRRGGGMRCAWG